MIQLRFIYAVGKEQNDSPAVTGPLLKKLRRGVKRVIQRFAGSGTGVGWGGNLLFATKVLLVEGDSDPIYLYELFRQLNALGKLDVDINSLGVMSFLDLQNLRFLIQLFKREENDSAVMVLADGDSTGKEVIKRICELASRLNVSTSCLRDKCSIENYCLFEPQFLIGARKAILNAYSAENKPAPKDLQEQIDKSWREYTRDAKVTAGRWFKELAKELLGDEVSKVVLARHYVAECRELAEYSVEEKKLNEAITLCQLIATNLQIPTLRGFALPDGPQRHNLR